MTFTHAQDPTSVPPMEPVVETWPRDELLVLAPLPLAEIYTAT